MRVGRRSSSPIARTPPHPASPRTPRALSTTTCGLWPAGIERIRKQVSAKKTVRSLRFELRSELRSRVRSVQKRRRSVSFLRLRTDVAKGSDAL